MERHPFVKRQGHNNSKQGNRSTMIYNRILGNDVLENSENSCELPHNFRDLYASNILQQ